MGSHMAEASFDSRTWGGSPENTMVRSRMGREKAKAKWFTIKETYTKVDGNAISGMDKAHSLQRQAVGTKESLRTA